MRALIINELTSPRWSYLVPGYPTAGDEVLQAFGVPNNRWGCVGWVARCVCVWRGGAGGGKGGVPQQGLIDCVCEDGVKWGQRGGRDC